MVDRGPLPVFEWNEDAALRGRCDRWRWAAAVMVLALAVRIIWGLAVPVAPVSDCVAYATFATHLAAGGAYGWDGATPSAYWPVGTAFIYSLVFRVWDPEVWGYGGAVVLNIAAGLAIVALGMVLAARWFGWAAGVTAGVLLALWPMHVQFTTIIASELFFTTFLLGGLVAWPATTAPMRQMLGRLVLAGLLFGAAAYVRPTALLLPAVLAGSAVLQNHGLWRSLLACGGVTAVMIAVILPWSMRNHAIFDRFVLISTNGGTTMWMGNNPESDGAYMPIPDAPPGMNEAEFNRLLSREAMAYIRSHPAAFVQRTTVKAVRMHERETIGIVWNLDGLRRVAGERSIEAMKWATQGYWLIVLGLGLSGLGMLVFRHGFWFVLTHPSVLIWGYFTAVHAVIVYQDRYHFPATPMIAALAAASLVAYWQRARRTARRWEVRR